MLRNEPPRPADGAVSFFRAAAFRLSRRPARYGKPAENFPAAVKRAAFQIWLRVYVSTSYLEIGNDWRRPNGTFDHLHLDLFYADKRSTRNPDTTPNEAGGGFKVAGEKQIDRFVGFASYTYNTAEGGGISTTVSGQTAYAGVAYLRPFDVQGEIGLGAMWNQSLPNPVSGRGPEKPARHGVALEYAGHAKFYADALDPAHLESGVQPGGPLCGDSQHQFRVFF